MTCLTQNLVLYSFLKALYFKIYFNTENLFKTYVTRYVYIIVRIVDPLDTYRDNYDQSIEI